MKIRYKLILGFTIIFFMSVAIINPLLKHAIAKNNFSVVKREFSDLSRNINIYINQFMDMENKKLTLDYLEKNYDSILIDLSDKIKYPMDFYDTGGDQLGEHSDNLTTIHKVYDPQIQKLLDTKKADFKSAVNGKLSFTVTKYNNAYYAVLSYPIISNKEVISVLRVSKSYDTLYSSGNRLFAIFEVFLLILFLILIVIFTIFLLQITNPIEALNKAVKKVSMGIYDVYVEPKSGDEIGELSANFSIMQNRIKTQIEDLKRLEAHRKKFLDNVTHELKTPLTTISGYAQILSEIGTSDEKFLDVAVSSIKREADRLNKMVVDLLQMSSLNEESCLFEMKENNISKILLQTVEDMKLKSDKYDFSLVCNIQKDVYVNCIAEHIKQVFINILDNAIKYGDTGTDIRVTLKTSGNAVIICIANNGTSIPHDMLNKIFEPFVRIDKSNSRERGSSGLGLSIVKNIIDKHNGTISIESENGITQVSISLQLCNKSVKTL